MEKLEENGECFKFKVFQDFVLKLKKMFYGLQNVEHLALF